MPQNLSRILKCSFLNRCTTTHNPSHQVETFITRPTQIQLRNRLTNFTRASLHSIGYLMFEYIQCCYNPALLNTNFQFLDY